MVIHQICQCFPLYVYILDDSKKFSILKKGIGIERENLWKQDIQRSKKQVGEWKQVREWKQVKDEAQAWFIKCRTKIKSKVFAIPILTAVLSTIINQMQSEQGY